MLHLTEAEAKALQERMNIPVLITCPTCGGTSFGFVVSQQWDIRGGQVGFSTPPEFDRDAGVTCTDCFEAFEGEQQYEFIAQIREAWERKMKGKESSKETK